MLKDLKAPFFTIVFIFLGLFLFIKFVGPVPFFVTNVNTTKESLFTVDGTGEVTAIPDTALITLGVNKQAASVESAQNEVNTIIKQIQTDIKNLGVEVKNIKTTNYSVNPNYDYSSGKQTLQGYVVDAQIEVKITPIDKANSAIDAATKDGATDVGGVQFILNDTAQKDLEKQARQEAIDNAKQKAQDLSSAAGLRLGRIIDIQENPSQAPRPIYPMAAMKADSAGAAPSTELNPGENKVSITVTLSYETY